MIQVKVITAAEPTTAQVNEFKAFAGISGTDAQRDAMLKAILKKAMLRVQEASDKAMLACTLALEADNVQAGEIFRLYQGGSAVSSVTDERGDSVPFLAGGQSVEVIGYHRGVRIAYANSVNAGDAAGLQIYALQYATALYDNDTAALAEIERRTYSFL